MTTQNQVNAIHRLARGGDVRVALVAGTQQRPTRRSCIAEAFWRSKPEALEDDFAISIESISLSFRRNAEVKEVGLLLSHLKRRPSSSYKKALLLSSPPIPPPRFLSRLLDGTLL